jgi:DNA-binding NarL/FixJ family response regulator
MTDRRLRRHGGWLRWQKEERMRLTERRKRILEMIEYDVLRLLAWDGTQTRIARALGVSCATVHRDCRAILAMFGIKVVPRSRKRRGRTLTVAEFAKMLGGE